MTAPTATTNWTARLRNGATRSFPPEELLPDHQPIYVASWIYVFGVATIAAFLVVLVSGGLLAVEGPQWWHRSSLGHYVNSLHLWSVELFMAFMVIHLWGKFFMAAWRGRRAMTWITGSICFLGSIGTAFSGYVIQSNLDSQWISTQARDGLNSAGIGGFEGDLAGHVVIVGYGGWLVALMAWLVASTHSTFAQIALIWLTTAPIAAFGFRHSIAGAVEAFYRAFTGDAPWGRMLGEFLVPALIGNVVGGVILVALLNHGQVAVGREEHEKPG